MGERLYDFLLGERLLIRLRAARMGERLIYDFLLQEWENGDTISCCKNRRTVIRLPVARMGERLLIRLRAARMGERLIYDFLLQEWENGDTISCCKNRRRLYDFLLQEWENGYTNGRTVIRRLPVARMGERLFDFLLQELENGYTTSCCENGRTVIWLADLTIQFICLG